ncbi:hypothetical protein [Pseudotabrizicola alkalilacus]|uniref:Uncharacterized protein n=1 Tax=Pseudotabrizicola alkalilacus TaxID=2305252 RepID=A0A411Z4C0_9RHOB|nr:hypothetical protein [Pseudotabrizicola alkalilacus]RGP37890.1 hypothetical protein D1012_08360 [Pseudotabrizicola alkalilacus]
MPETGKCGNIIFCPSTKLFLLPAIMMHEFFTAAGEKSKIVIDKNMLPQAQEIGDDFCDFETAVQYFEDCDSIRSVCFHHDDTQFQALVRNLNMVRTVFPKKRNLVSFYPDGFGNAMHGKSYVERLSNVFSDEVTVDQYLSFGFVHKTTVKLAADRPIQTLSFSLLTDFFDRSVKIRKFCNLEKLSGVDLDECVMLAYRPWCTKTFHDGMYDFGNQQELAILYGSLIERAEKDHGRSLKVIFRADERYKRESDLVRRLLSSRFDVIDLDSFYSQALTLEPLVYFLIKTGQVSKMSMICLDSTSFQVPAFLVQNMGAGRLVGYLGAPKEDVYRMSGGEAFTKRKLGSKMSDFRERYRAFESDGIVESVTDLCNTFIRVGTT